MEASHCLDTKNQNIITKVQSVSSTSTVKHNSEQSSASWPGGSEKGKQIEEKKLSSSQTTTTTNSDHIQTGNSGSFYLLLAGWFLVKYQLIYCHTVAIQPYIQNTIPTTYIVHTTYLVVVNQNKTVLFRMHHLHLNCCQNC